MIYEKALKNDAEINYQIFFSKPIKRFANKFSCFLSGCVVLDDTLVEDAIVVVTKRFIKYVGRVKKRDTDRIVDDIFVVIQQMKKKITILMSYPVVIYWRLYRKQRLIMIG